MAAKTRMRHITEQGVSFNNERFFRYPEVLLLHAEALLNGGTPKGISIYQTADACVNKTRQRAGLTSIDGRYHGATSKRKTKRTLF